MNTNRIFGRSSLGGMGWRATANSRPGRFQARRNASPELLRRGAILEHRPGGTRPTILKLPPTRRATRKRPGTTWLTRKLLWTLGTRRRGREREPHKIGYSGDHAWVVWDGEQRQALVRTVSKPGEMPHRNHSAEEQFSSIALAADPHKGLITLARPADTNSASKR